MAKLKTKWICQNCGYETAKYLGKCPDCGQWNTLVEEVFESISPSQAAKTVLNDTIPCLINDIEIDRSIRFTTGIEEFDRVLGGGLVQGSIVLLAGDPGIGKSTILLQTGKAICKDGRTALYVSAEESASQVKLRAQRLGVQSNSLYIYSQTNFEAIKRQIDEIKPQILIIDSIQAVYTDSVTSSPGSVSQIRECTNILMDIAKNKNITVVVIGHVTKEGNIAGPKVLEHMVDTVIYFEGDRYKSYRLLRCMKNRFGTTNEVGVFNMCDDGLHEISNPSELFLNERTQNNTPGSVIIATNEGSRPLLIEIQALVGTTSYPSPRRVSNGIDYNRLLQILAVLEKRIGLNLSKQDVYVNVIGGLEIDEPAADLGVALAVATCARDVCVSPDTVIVGEIGLSGEIRAINNLDKRIKESEKLGFKKIIVPQTNTLKKEEFKNINIVQVKRLMDAITACVSKSDKTTVS
ncbi:MAG TPA: DNA repair protein RadA [Candidatus Limenecus avicola]|jgi:DNA repair protein radA|uniref:DNA repair protein RadA n=1 Tax=Candidatus Limenecus avicola TaxID=2840847 RepID=A0A9D1N0A6_9CLOT|nr:DNA repair protein RadA [Candidatus Limenecus avicola]